MTATHTHSARPGERPASAAELQLQQQVLDALRSKTPLAIQGANSKAFLGRPATGQVLDTRQHSGIVNYDPTELVVTVRSGTPLVELLDALDQQGQMLPCEPPVFGVQPPWAAWSRPGCPARVGPGPARYVISYWAPR